jgi:hypothetical protein
MYSYRCLSSQALVLYIVCCRDLPIVRSRIVTLPDFCNQRLYRRRVFFHCCCCFHHSAFLCLLGLSGRRRAVQCWRANLKVSQIVSCKRREVSYILRQKIRCAKPRSKKKNSFAILFRAFGYLIEVSATYWGFMVRQSHSHSE